jgi:hypothetical protein
VTDLRGLPARRHFKILYNNISTIVKQVCTETANCEIPTTYTKEEEGTVCTETTNLFVRKRQHIKTEEIKTDQTLGTFGTLSVPPAPTIKKKILINRNLVINEEPVPHPDRKPRISKPIKKHVLKKTNEVLDIIEHWVSKGFYMHNPGTNSEAKAVSDILALLDGTLFESFKNKGVIRRYRVPEIKQAIDNFALAAFHRDYKPDNLSFKQRLRHTPLCNYFYDSRKGEESSKSIFLRYFFNKPDLISESRFLAVKDSMPEITKVLSDWYKNKFVTKNNGHLSVEEQNTLVYTVRRLKEYQETNNLYIDNEWKRIYGTFDDIKFLAIQLTRTFDKEFRENEGMWSKFHVGWLKSDKTFTERLPKFLRAEHVIK